MMKIDVGGEMMFQKREENGVKGGDEWCSVEAGKKEGRGEREKKFHARRKRKAMKKNEKKAKEMALLIFITIRK